MHPADLITIALLGLLGSAHCIGMCGVFAIAANRPAQNWQGLFLRHSLYIFGKTITYIFLALLLTAGTGWLSGRSWFHQAQIGLAVFVGLLMIFLGVRQIVPVAWTGWFWKLFAPSPSCQAIGAVLRTPHPAGAFAIGWLNGFLPCGLLLAALFYIASFLSLRDAVIGAIVFGLATAPSLLAAGSLSKFLRPGSRSWILQLAGWVIILMGVLTILRGIPAAYAWMMDILPESLGNLLPEWCAPQGH